MIWKRSKIVRCRETVILNRFRQQCGGIDRNGIPMLGSQIVAIRKQALKIGFSCSVRVLEAGGGDAIGELEPWTIFVIAAEAADGVAVNEAAPLDRKTDPKRGGELSGAENGNRAVNAHGRWGRRPKVNKGNAGPGPVFGFVEESGIVGKFVTEKIGADKVGAGENVRGVKRHFPCLGAARDGIVEFIERAQQTNAFSDQRAIAAESSAFENGSDVRSRESVGFVQPVCFGEVEATVGRMIFDGTVRFEQIEVTAALGQSGRDAFFDGAVNESFGGMANVADSSGVVVGRRNKSEGFASGFVQPRSENALGNIVGEPIHEERSVGDGGAAEIVANGVTEFGAIADF